MSEGLRELEQRVRSHPGALEEFLSQHTFPLVEGSNATFLFRGAADQVLLRHWIQGLASPLPFQRLAGTDAWALVVELPPCSRVEYKLEVAHGPHRQLLQDPLNPNLARDPFGANSVVHGPGYQVPDWTLPDPDARPGTVVTHQVPSPALGDTREVSVYLPARFRKRRRHPLLIVHDGEDYRRFSSLDTVLDNLIHRGEIPGLVVALTQSPRRMSEYAGGPEHGDFLVQDLLPFLEREYPLVPEPSARGLLGASFGAVAALSTAWRHPGVFDKLLLQSGSFVFTDIGSHERGAVFDPVVEFMNAFRKEPGAPARQLFVSCGTFEGNIYYNRSLVPFLETAGLEVRFREAPDGHNWENWRDRLREGLSWLFPGPLWMVYE